MVRKCFAKNFPLLLLLILATAAAASTAGPGQSAVPRTELPQATFAFGKVVEGATVVHEFTIRNVGDAPLHIKKVRTG